MFIYTGTDIESSENDQITVYNTKHNQNTKTYFKIFQTSIFSKNRQSFESTFSAHLYGQTRMCFKTVSFVFFFKLLSRNVCSNFLNNALKTYAFRSVLKIISGELNKSVWECGWNGVRAVVKLCSGFDVSLERLRSF